MGHMEADDDRSYLCFQHSHKVGRLCCRMLRSFTQRKLVFEWPRRWQDQKIPSQESCEDTAILFSKPCLDKSSASCPLAIYSIASTRLLNPKTQILNLPMWAFRADGKRCGKKNPKPQTLSPKPQTLTEAIIHWDDSQVPGIQSRQVRLGAAFVSIRFCNA